MTARLTPAVTSSPCFSFNDLPSSECTDVKFRVDEILYQHFVYAIGLGFRMKDCAVAAERLV